MKDDAIDAVVFETKSGRLAIRAKQVIDCTGDGDIFHLAGEDYDEAMDRFLEYCVALSAR